MLNISLDYDISCEYETLRQPDYVTDIKESLRKKLEQQLKSRLPYWMRPIEVVLMGSSYNSDMAMENSDLDIAIAIRGYDGDNIQKLNIVEDIFNEMRAVYNSRIIGNKPPVLRFCMTTGDEVMHEMKVDAQIYSTVVARSKILVRLLMRADRRLAPLAVILKQWAKVHNIYDASLGRLSSHAIVLLLIQYLQCEVEPELPCLHELYPRALNDPDLTAMLDLEPLMGRYNHCLPTQGDILIYFFRYYGFTFDFSTELVSVRDGRPRQRGPEDTGFIVVEEPFGLTNVTKTIKSLSVYNQIIKACRDSYDRLKTRRWPLESILQIDETYD